MTCTRCFHCQDLGFVIENSVRRNCWRMQTGIAHNKPNEAAKMIDRAVDHLMIRKIVIEPQHFEIAKLLSRYTTEKPFSSAHLLDSHLVLPLRSFMGVIEDLRKIWLLPVGSRKCGPAGYWIITDEKDFAEWVERAKAAPITQLTTIYDVAKRNFPALTGQLELDIWSEMRGSDAPRQMAA